MHQLLCFTQHTTSNSLNVHSARGPYAILHFADISNNNDNNNNHHHQHHNHSNNHNDNNNNIIESVSNTNKANKGFKKSEKCQQTVRNKHVNVIIIRTLLMLWRILTDETKKPLSCVLETQPCYRLSICTTCIQNTGTQHNITAK